MCGISGFIDYKHHTGDHVLKDMTDSLAHRGPEASGYKTERTEQAVVGLGHRRLSIIDLSESGNQPMQFQDIWVVFNGEIYNFQEIKEELKTAGHTFTSHSDTEVILHAYKEWGIKCVDRFIGMFAIVLYDISAGEVYCIRDRAGIKPFFYYWHNGLFLFASELKAFHKHPAFTKKINHNALAAFMQYGNVPTPHCIFEHCFKLKPGHILTFHLEKGSYDVSKYWDVYDAYNKPKLDISFAEAKTETERILQSAFDYRMVSDVPVGVFLSGGYDSACLTALLQKDRTEKIKTFTIGVPDIGLNEAGYARDVSKHLGTEHYEYTCSQKEALDIIEELPYYYDEPFADSSAIPTTLVCKMARKEVTVALSADAGDEVFAGYNRYDYLMKYGKRLNQLPSYARKGASKLMHYIPAGKIPVLKKKYNFYNRYEKLKSLLHDPSPFNIAQSLSKQFTGNHLHKLVIRPFDELDTAYISRDLRKEYHSPLAYMMAVDYQTYLLDDILQKVDRASMSVSLEAREPFLDHRVIEWAARLPDHYKYYKGSKKHIVREIVHDYIPKSLMDRPKMGFAIPIENWLSHELKQQVLHYLDDALISKQEIFHVQAVQNLKADFFNGKKELGVKIWYLLMFQMWYQKWMV